MGKKTIGILVGSLRRDSLNKKVARYLSGLLEEQFDIKFLDIANLVMYNQDLDNESDTPSEWRQFRNEVKAVDAVLFVTPEYNRSMPAVLKNALDIASRPFTDNAWGGKPGAVVSVSPGKTGAFGANHHLRQVAACLDIYMMQQPEAYVGGIAGSVDANGVSDERVQSFLRKFAGAFADWVDRFTGQARTADKKSASQSETQSSMSAPGGGAAMRKYACDVCGYVYDPKLGDPDGGIAPGTAWEAIPENWVCPVCGARKSMFSPA